MIVCKFLSGDEESEFHVRLVSHLHRVLNDVASMLSAKIFIVIHALLEEN